MQKVIRVSSEEAGFECVAKDFSSAVDYLVKNYFRDTKIVYSERYEDFLPLISVLPNWREDIPKMSREEFEEFFDEQLFVYDEEIYGT